MPIDHHLIFFLKQTFLWRMSTTSIFNIIATLQIAEKEEKESLTLGVTNMEELVSLLEKCGIALGPNDSSITLKRKLESLFPSTAEGMPFFRTNWNEIYHPPGVFLGYTTKAKISLFSEFFPKSSL